MGLQNKSKKIGFMLAGLALFALWIFFYIAFEVTEHGLGDHEWIGIDQNIINALTRYRSDLLTSVMLAFTYLGSTISIFLISLVAVVMSHFKKLFSERRLILFSGTVSAVSINAAKIFFGRARPSPSSWLMPASGLSFPSGHTTGSFAVLGTLFYILGRMCDKPYQRNFIWALGLLVILTIGISRIYLGVHFPTDVMGGIFLGFSILLFSISYDDFLKRKKV